MKVSVSTASSGNYLWNSIDADSTNSFLYETFAFYNYFIHLVKYNMTTLEVVEYKVYELPYN